MQVGDTPQKNIKVALGLSQTQYGLVTGTVFTFTNGTMGLVWGHLSDKYNRKWPLTMCCFLMTGMAVLISWCQNFGQVLVARILFAIFMSANVPVSVSLICDYAAPHERGRAQSLFACGMYLGVGLSSLSELLDEAAGWRAAIRYIGLICLAFAFMMFLLMEPKRNATSKELIANVSEDAVEQGERD
jgi:MFS family permease